MRRPVETFALERKLERKNEEEHMPPEAEEED